MPPNPLTAIRDYLTGATGDHAPPPLSNEPARVAFRAWRDENRLHCSEYGPWGVSFIQGWYAGQRQLMAQWNALSQGGMK